MNARGASVAAFLVVVALAPLALLPSLRARPDLAILFALLASVPYAVVVWCAWRGVGDWRAWIVAGIAMRALLLVPDEGLSDDVWRYRFEARVLAHGENPWRHAPGSDALVLLRDADVWSRVAHKDVACVYPPLGVVACTAIETVAPAARAFRVAFVLADVLVALLLVRMLRRMGLESKRAVVWWLSPLVVLEVAGSGHFEPLAIALALAAFIAAHDHKPTRAGLWIAAAALVKPIALVLLPFVARGSSWPRTTAAALALVAAGLAPVVATAGLDQALSFATNWSANAPVFPALLDLANELKDRFKEAALGGAYTHETNQRIFALDPQRLARGAALALFCLAWLALALSRIDRAAKAMFVLAIALVLSPVVHPWYVLWCVPFVALAWSPGTFAWTLTVVLAYHALVSLDVFGVAMEEPLLRAAQFLPVFAWWIVEAVRWRSARATT